MLSLIFLKENNLLLLLVLILLMLALKGVSFVREMLDLFVCFILFNFSFGFEVSLFVFFFMHAVLAEVVLGRS